MVLWQCPCTITIKSEKPNHSYRPDFFIGKNPSLDSWVQKTPSPHHSLLRHRQGSNPEGLPSPNPNWSIITSPNPNRSIITSPNPNWSIITSPKPNWSVITLPKPNWSIITSPNPNSPNSTSPNTKWFTKTTPTPRK
ncbi:hypothetical protein AVEN_75649-1 [Araneus ventricosus]|uniref:Uncharacterized protein n=1 Tax=Araneus ventricosus TaxID=182803 RepID=A0A4Y2D4P8_ARAVE|nr:hypothetical protein AVEN_75649-1 [Araneus ventricosus]